MKKLSGWKTKGMNRDLSVSAFNPEFAFENMNLRLSTNEGNTMMSWVNEKGTKPMDVREWSKGSTDTFLKELSFIPGTAIGTAVLNDYLVIFLTNRKGDKPDCIYRFHYPPGCTYLLAVMLFEGDLGFSVGHPLETLVSYEAEDIQKVYWVDGINQPRLINIAPFTDEQGRYAGEREYKTDTAFDFIPTLQLNEDIRVRKVTGGGGMFAPGVIQYAFTYYYKHGQESNIFYTTPLIYISHIDRGASPEDKVDNVFKIYITGIDTNFDYLRIYSIQRTSINATPVCKRVQDIEIANCKLVDADDEGKGKKTTYTDTGTSGNSIDPMELLYKGGNVTAVGTIEQKDNTLFLGDLVTPENRDLTDLVKAHTVNLKASSRTFYPIQTSTGDYDYANQLNSCDENGYSVPCAGFKYGNKYRCGLQFQDAHGKWTTPVWLDDLEVNNSNSDIEEIHPSMNVPQGDWEDTGNDEAIDTTLKIHVTVVNNIVPTQEMRILRIAQFALSDGTVLSVSLKKHANSSEDGSDDFIIDPNQGEEWEMYNFSTIQNGLQHLGKTIVSATLYSTGGKLNYVLEGINDVLEDGKQYTLTCTKTEKATVPVPSSPSATSSGTITLKIYNGLSVEARLSGKIKLNLSKDPNSWSTATEVDANLHGPTIGDSWAYNDVIIQPGGTYTKAVSLENVYSYDATKNFLDGTWYFINFDKGLYVHSVYLYSRMWSRSKNEDSGSNHMYVVGTPPQNTVLQAGKTYTLNISWINPEASLAPDHSGSRYVILEEGKADRDW